MLNLKIPAAGLHDRARRLIRGVARSDREVLKHHNYPVAPDYFREALALLGVGDQVFLEELTVPTGTTAYLSSDPDLGSALAPRSLRTGSIDEFKSWMSLDDESHARTPERMRWEPPAAPWSGREVSDAEALSDPEREQVERAYWAYVYGDSHLVKSYRQVLERCYAPFEAALYTASRVSVEPDASLIVTGAPAILLLEDLIIEAGGSLEVRAECSALIGRLHKSSADRRMFN